MPGMSGIEVLKEIKRLKPDIEVIVITGFHSLKPECMRLGAFDYITKPFKVPEVISIIKKCIQHINLKKEESLLKAENIELKRKEESLKRGQVRS
jgi:two-component system NtrC family response regulator